MLFWYVFIFDGDVFVLWLKIIVLLCLDSVFLYLNLGFLKLSFLVWFWKKKLFVKFFFSEMGFIEERLVLNVKFGGNLRWSLEFGVVLNFNGIVYVGVWGIGCCIEFIVLGW